MKYYTYVHTLPNGKRYVGITSQDLQKRWRYGAGYIHNRRFACAIMKCGWNNITHTVYEVETKSEMYYLERYLIAFYQTCNPLFGYNKSIGGENGGLKYSTDEERKRKHRQYMKEYMRDYNEKRRDDYNQYMRDYNANRHKIAQVDLQN